MTSNQKLMNYTQKMLALNVIEIGFVWWGWLNDNVFVAEQEKKQLFNSMFIPTNYMDGVKRFTPSVICTTIDMV